MTGTPLFFFERQRAANATRPPRRDQVGGSRRSGSEYLYYTVSHQRPGSSKVVPRWHRSATRTGLAAAPDRRPGPADHAGGLICPAARRGGRGGAVTTRPSATLRLACHQLRGRAVMYRAGGRLRAPAGTSRRLGALQSKTLGWTWRGCPCRGRICCPSLVDGRADAGCSGRASSRQAGRADSPHPMRLPRFGAPSAPETPITSALGLRVQADRGRRLDQPTWLSRDVRRAVTVPFTSRGSSTFFGEMLAALQEAGDVTAMVDDDVRVRPPGRLAEL